jgi:hypothetical protein
LNVSIPHEPFNTAVHSDIAGTTMARFISYTLLTVTSHSANGSVEGSQPIHP